MNSIQFKVQLCGWLKSFFSSFFLRLQQVLRKEYNPDYKLWNGVIPIEQGFMEVSFSHLRENEGGKVKIVKVYCTKMCIQSQFKPQALKRCFVMTLLLFAEAVMKQKSDLQ